MKIAQEQTIKNPNILRFFRSICKYNGKGISANQEILHDFLIKSFRPETDKSMQDLDKSSQELGKALFLPIKM